MLISKKELLAETGISYGQLYRWKREHLIPEEWFIKQSSFTGQETFFPKELMLNRIRAIQDLKDKYSLEELARMLSPELDESGFRISELSFMEEINSDMLTIFRDVLGQETVTYIEVIMMVILSGVSEELSLSSSQTGDMLKNMKKHLADMRSTGYILAVIAKDSDFYGLIYQEQTPLFLDDRIRIVKQVRMNDVSNEMKIKYRGKFNVQNDRFERDRRHEENTGESDGDKEQDDGCKDEDFVIKINNWEVRL